MKEVSVNLKGKCFEVTNNNFEEITSLIKKTYETTKQVVEVISYENGEIDIDNQTFNRMDVCVIGDYVVITEKGVFIYPTKEEMESIWK